MMQSIPMTTQDEFADYKVTETLGLVRGSTVRARFVGRDFIAFLRTIKGGEVDEYTYLLQESREQAIQRMIEGAQAAGADGITAVRLITSSVAQSASEILAYGTAVKLIKK